MSRNSFGLLLLLAGCDAGTVTNRTQRSGEVKVAGVEEIGNNGSAALEGVGAPMAWRVVNGAAFYGAADQPPAFALRCDRAAQQIVFERAGAGGTLSLAAGGAGASLGTREVGQGRVQARAGLDDAIVNAMARPQSQITVAGGAETLTLPGGVAIRRVVDFCRNPPATQATPEAAPPPVVVPQTIDEPAPDPLPTPPTNL
ncbi:hypothetical protein [Sphingomonas sp.]|jgi:hypothetical protein|uniref:hypothetical protein n=1 Tax=Sphingomonas sp. TaxID=28214 RepID=UPI002DF0D13F|nr:hypothetical protein [Sphingomonas sp.]